MQNSAIHILCRRRRRRLGRRCSKLPGKPSRLPSFTSDQGSSSHKLLFILHCFRLHPFCKPAIVCRHNSHQLECRSRLSTSSLVTRLPPLQNTLYHPPNSLLSLSNGIIFALNLISASRALRLSRERQLAAFAATKKHKQMPPEFCERQSQFSDASRRCFTFRAHPI